ncbi:collagen-like protein [Porticoccaceae bacterium]|nr:collagen-like protein [Porticoccaceae bacterium]
MLTLINRFSKYSIVILGFLAITLSHAQEDRAEDISILDVDANGEVDALTDGLLLLRSMFELTDDALVTGVVDSANCKECDAEGIDSYITSIKGTTYGGLTPEAGPAGPQGEKGDKGDTGPAGPQGEKGDTGPQGVAGADGAKGDTGSQGIAGATGAKGDIGSQGLAGAKGDTGATGPKGDTGAKGDTGSQGVAGTNGTDGSDGANGASGGAVGISFSMELRGSPTQWSNNAPPQNLIVDSQGPYILYTGEDSNTNNIIPLLAKNFEFIHLEGNSWAGSPTPSPGDFPIAEHVQANNVFITPINGHKLPQLGPQPNASSSYNNFYGFRVPQDGQMVGFQINYIQKPMTGQFYAMYYYANSGNPRVIFNKGGPLVGNMNSSGPISQSYASGNTLWDDSVIIPVKANGFIFVMSDLSFRYPSGVYASNWNGPLGPGPSIPFRPPTGKIHATVYVTYD